MAKEYKIKDIKPFILREATPNYYINNVRNGLKYAFFVSLSKLSTFSEKDWSGYLHISERTLQRYKKEHKSFDSLHSEKILQIVLLFQKGVQVFDTTDIFNEWLSTTSVALGNIQPKSLLDSSFGINIVKDELGRIEHGVF